jgi:hypothetical protein
MNTTQTTESTATVHPFEAAGLGKAPFRYVGQIVQDMMHGQVILNREEFQRTGIAVCTKPGGTCDFCGTFIVRMFKIRSADLKEFKVGCDCLAKVDPAMGKKAKASLRKASTAKRAACKAAGIELEREAVRDAVANRSAELAARPHPHIRDLTALDYCNWILEHNCNPRKACHILFALDKA